MINPNPAKIEDILNSSIQFVVPRYQREYTWGKSEALEFLDDLKSCAESEHDNLFLGTIIFDVSEADQKKIKVVDGQQRITTVLLLLIACRQLAKKINVVNLATLIQDKITFTDPTTAESLGCRLIASESIKDVLEEISKHDWNGTFPARVNGKQVKRQVNRIKPIYDFFLSEVANFDQSMLSNFLKTIYGAYVVRIEIEDEVEAFSIFERTNARGVDLEASDLLKNYLFAQGVEGLDETWSQIIENSDGTVLRMLKFFYVAKRGYVTKSDLYKKIRIYGEEIGAAQLVGELDEFSRFYSAIRTADSSGIGAYFEACGCTKIASNQDRYERIHTALEGLRLFKISQHFPLIFACISCFVRNGKGDDSACSKKLVQFFELMEKYHFINNAVCERIGNEVEKLYADFCVKFANSVDFAETTKALADSLKKRLASEDEFTSQFVEIAYSPAEIPKISYIFDRFNNVGLHSGQRVKIFNPDQKILRKSHNIEHFYPQNPESDMVPDPETMEVVDNIGNLLVISIVTNSRLGNLSPKKKFEKMKNELNREIQNLSYVRKFVEEYEGSVSSWGSEIIAERAKGMAKLAYGKVWKID